MPHILFPVVLLVGILGVIAVITNPDSDHWESYGVIYMLVWFIAVIVSGFWKMMYTPPSEVKKDVELGMKIMGVCRYCGKKLPSFFTGRCPHCTADL